MTVGLSAVTRSESSGSGARMGSHGTAENQTNVKLWQMTTNTSPAPAPAPATAAPQ